MTLALLVFLAVAIGVVLYMTKSKKPNVSIQYDASAAYDLLRKSGKLIEPQEGIVPFRLGVTKIQFLALWKNLDSFDFEPFYKLQVNEVDRSVFESPVAQEVSQMAATQIFLMKLIARDLLESSGSSAKFSGVEEVESRLDGIFVRSDAREYGVSKYILDAFEDDESAISEDTIQGVVEFMRKNFRPI